MPFSNGKMVSGFFDSQLFINCYFGASIVAVTCELLLLVLFCYFVNR